MDETNETTDNQPVTTNQSPSQSANESGSLKAERGKVGKVIVVTDTAYVTYVLHSCFSYLLTIKATSSVGKLCSSICTQAISHSLLLHALMASEKIVSHQSRLRNQCIGWLTK
jgi:hypothetical protein